MNIENIHRKKLSFKDTFIYLKEVLLGNFFGFLKMLLLWVLFAFVFFYVVPFLPDYVVALLSILAYIVFYLFYLAFIAQSRAVIEETKLGTFACLKDIYKEFLHRKGFDLLELLPIALVVFLIVFFPSSIFAVPLAFIITLATIIYVVYTILTQPVLVIKKMQMFAAIRYAVSLINGYFTFVLGLIITLAFACLVLYIPFVFIKTSFLAHKVLVCFSIGIEVMLFAIMLTIVYTNLEIAWSVGFKNYNQEDIISNRSENNHEFTEFFNRVPEVQIKEYSKESEDQNLDDK